jgi:predicted nucleic-acid-binding Zn-ribbon protein
MSDRFVFITRQTTCHHCTQVADHIIKVVPYKAEVACTNCGSTRVFVPRIQDVSRPGAFTPISCHDIWELKTDAECRNCHVTGPHDLMIACRHLTVRCRNCEFTHFYKLDIEFIGKDELKIQ